VLKLDRRHADVSHCSGFLSLGTGIAIWRSYGRNQAAPKTLS
jgi:hypothetical protein